MRFFYWKADFTLRVIGILLFLAWLASFFFFVIGHIASYTLLLLTILAISVHFILAYRRCSAGKEPKATVP